MPLIIEQEPPAAVVEKLKGEHGEVTLVPIGQCQLIVRRPKREEFKRFRDQVQRDTTRGAAAETLARTCVLWPEKADLETGLDKYPAVLETLAGELLEMVGFRQSGEKKVL